MRRSLSLTVLAVTSMVAVAFALPLGLLVRSAAEDRATSSAEQEARSVAGVLATVTDPDALRGIVEQIGATSSHGVTVLLEDGDRLGAPLDVPAERVAAARGGQAFSFDHGGSRVVAVPVRTPAGLSVVLVSTDHDQMRQGVTAAWVTIAVLSLVIVAIGVILAARIARGPVRSIEHLGAVTRRLRQGEMDARVDISGPPEVADAGRAVNDLADQIDSLLADEREAAADLSHRLRTPLTALQLQADSIRSDEDRARISDAVRGLTQEVNEVIAAARRPRPLRERTASADLAQVVRARMAFWQVLARQQGRAVTARISEDPIHVAASAEDLTAAVDTILTNVFQHTPEGTSFAVTVRDGGTPTVVVEDDGPGAPEPAPEQRGVSAGGSTGLGLDIVRRTAEASGGRFELCARDGGGTRVEITFGRAG